MIDKKMNLKKTNLPKRKMKTEFSSGWSNCTLLQNFLHANWTDLPQNLLDTRKNLPTQLQSFAQRNPLGNFCFDDQISAGKILSKIINPIMAQNNTDPHHIIVSI